VCGDVKNTCEQWRLGTTNLRPDTRSSVRERIADASRERLRIEAFIDKQGTSHPVRAIDETAGSVNACASCVEAYAADPGALEPAYQRPEPDQDPWVHLRSLPTPAAAMEEMRLTTCTGCGQQRFGVVLLEGRDYGIGDGRWCLECATKFRALSMPTTAPPATPALAGSAGDAPDEPVRSGRLGRPRGSGTFGDRADFLTTIVPIIRDVTAKEGHATQPRVAWYLTESGQLSCDEGTIRYWLRRFGLTWKEVLAIAAGPT
jgi:hypothetical protein